MEKTSKFGLKNASLIFVADSVFSLFVKEPCAARMMLSTSLL
jgi:hypothetical protein